MFAISELRIPDTFRHNESSRKVQWPLAKYVLPRLEAAQRRFRKENRAWFQSRVLLV